MRKDKFIVEPYNGDDFAIFIMVWGRPEKDWTYRSLRRHGYTGKIYLVADDLDETVEGYREKYGEELLVFDKKLAASKMDAGDNSGDLRSTLFVANTIKELAKEKGITYYMIMCDDYTGFDYRFNSKKEYKGKRVANLDMVFSAMLGFYKTTPTLTIAMAQGGDFMGGEKGTFGKAIGMRRKAMNSFLCSVDRPFDFLGRLNEDVTTYVRLGSLGYLFFTPSVVSLSQTKHQSQKSGLTDVYLDYGTYVKSFMSLIYNPSSIKVGVVGSKHKRIHHHVNWAKAVPVIISEEVKKQK